MAIKTVRHLGVIGECNIQYALNPDSKQVFQSFVGSSIHFTYGCSFVHMIDCLSESKLLCKSEDNSYLTTVCSELATAVGRQLIIA